MTVIPETGTDIDYPDGVGLRRNAADKLLQVIDVSGDVLWDANAFVGSAEPLSERHSWRRTRAGNVQCLTCPGRQNQRRGAAKVSPAYRVVQEVIRRSEEILTTVEPVPEPVPPVDRSRIERPGRNVILLHFPHDTGRIRISMENIDYLAMDDLSRGMVMFIAALVEGYDESDSIAATLAEVIDNARHEKQSLRRVDEIVGLLSN